MNLSNLFANTETQTKIASMAPSAPASGASAASARAAVDAALQSTTMKTAGVTQTAPSGSPTADLDKVAAEIVEQNHQRRMKQAFDEGRAHCDGFMSQLAVYEKVAAERAPQNEFAGYSEAEKVAAEQAQEERVVQQIHKVASDHYLGGYEAARAVVQ